MVACDIYSITSARIANFHRINSARIAENQLHIGAQKRFVKPHENIADHFRSEKINRENSTCRVIRTELQVGVSMMQVAEATGKHVSDCLLEMKEMVTRYYDASTTTEEQAALVQQFNNLGTSVSDLISDTYYNGKRVIQDTSASDPIFSILLNPSDITQTFDIDFDSNDVPDTGALNIAAGEATAGAAVQAEIDKAGSYLAKVSGYLYGLESQYNLTVNKIVRNEETKSTISDVDASKEVMQLTKRSIQQQAAMAMFAQSNKMRQSVLRLFE